MQFCQGHWDPNLQEGRKALIPAQRVVAAVPDFSWGWAAVAGAFWKVAMSAENSRISEEARASGRQAADRAVAIDSRNSEALYIKSMLAYDAELTKRMEDDPKRTVVHPSPADQEAAQKAMEPVRAAWIKKSPRHAELYKQVIAERDKVRAKK